MAHILIAYKQFPAPAVGHAGGESLFRLMEGLHKLGHRLTLVARIAAEERAHYPAVEALCEQVYTVPHHRALPGPRVLAFLRSYLLFRRALRHAIKVTNPDFLHVETTQTALAAVGLRRPPASYRTQDVNWYLAAQRAAHLTGAKRARALVAQHCFRYFEPWLVRRYDLMLAISEGDRRLLAPVCPRHPLQILPLTPAVVQDGGGARTGAEAPSPNLLFVGAMSRDHNQAGIRWFLDEVWPRILMACGTEHAGLRLHIVGGAPPAWLQARGQDPNAAGARVIVTGFVDDLASWYRQATVFVSPLLVAGGLLQKVVDAMALGVPVVATSACNHGVSATPGVHLLTADDAVAFADAVVSLLHDAELRQRVGEAGRAFVLAHYNLDAAVAHWSEAVEALIAARQARR